MAKFLPIMLALCSMLHQKLCWHNGRRPTPYPQMFFHKLSVEQHNLIEVMVTTAIFFSMNATKAM